MVRVCLDLDVLIEAAIGLVDPAADPAARRLLAACREGRCELVVSEQMLWDLVEALMEDPIALSYNTAVQWMAKVRQAARLASGADALEAAQDGGAHILVTRRSGSYATRAGLESGALRSGDVWILDPGDSLDALGLS